MSKGQWLWLVLALVPGCLLVQPLDDAKPDANGKGGAGSLAGSGNAGRPMTSGGGQQAGGAGPSGGGTGRAGAANGGAANTVDFSLFTGVWTISAGSIITNCDGTIETSPATPGGQDVFTLGTTSDLILDEATECPLLADVSDRVAIGQPDQSCSFTDPGTGNEFDVLVYGYDFTVSGQGQTATAVLTSTSTTTVTNPVSGVSQSCDTDQTIYLRR